MCSTCLSTASINHRSFCVHHNSETITYITLRILLVRFLSNIFFLFYFYFLRHSLLFHHVSFVAMPRFLPLFKGIGCIISLLFYSPALLYHIGRPLIWQFRYRRPFIFCHVHTL